jgi:hypothetical protein
MDHHKDALGQVIGQAKVSAVDDAKRIVDYTKLAKGGIISAPKLDLMPGPGQPGHLDPIAQLTAAYCRACRNRADVLPIAWPEIADICEYKNLKRVSDGDPDWMRDADHCTHGACGKVVRCCRIECPIWIDLKSKRRR